MIEIYHPPAYHLEINHSRLYPPALRHGRSPAAVQLITKDDKRFIINQIEQGLGSNPKQNTFHTFKLNDFDTDGCEGVVISQLDEYQHSEIQVHVAFNTYLWTVHIKLPYFISEVHANLVREGLKSAVFITNQPMRCLVDRVMM